MLHATANALPLALAAGGIVGAVVRTVSSRSTTTVTTWWPPTISAQVVRDAFVGALIGFLWVPIIQGFVKANIPIVGVVIPDVTTLPMSEAVAIVAAFSWAAADVVADRVTQAVTWGMAKFPKAEGGGHT